MGREGEAVLLLRHAATSSCSPLLPWAAAVAARLYLWKKKVDSGALAFVSPPAAASFVCSYSCTHTHTTTYIARCCWLSPAQPTSQQTGSRDGCFNPMLVISWFPLHLPSQGGCSLCSGLYREFAWALHVQIICASHSKLSSLSYTYSCKPVSPIPGIFEQGSRTVFPEGNDTSALY